MDSLNPSKVTSEDPESDKLLTASAVIEMLLNSRPTAILMMNRSRFDPMPMMLANLP
jgi:hypothetical protein